MIYKHADLSFAVSSQARENNRSQVQFSTQDQGTAKLIFTFTKGKDPVNLVDITAELTLIMADNSKFVVAPEVTQNFAGQLEYTLTPEQIRHYGKVQAEIVLKYSNGNKIGGFEFEFTIKQALVDRDNKPVQEFYVEDFEVIRKNVQAKADSVNLDITNFKAGIDRRTTAIEKDFTTFENNINTRTTALETKVNGWQANIDQTTIAQVDTARTDTQNQTHADLDSRIKAEVGRVNTQIGDLAEGIQISLEADVDSTPYKAGKRIDIEKLRLSQAKNFFTFMKKIRNREAVKIVCQGDSLTYGSDVNSSDKRPAPGITNSDGSVSGVTIASITYPEALQNYLNQVYRSTVNPQIVSVETRAYPGDWAPKSFARHFLKHTGDLTILMLGTNDSRRSEYPDAGNINVFYYWMEQIIIRELLWDKAVVLLTPPKNTGFDLAVDAFANAVYGIGEKYGVPVIDSDEFLSQYPASVYSDATHFNGTGYNVFGSRVAALLIGEGAHKPKEVLGGSVLLTRRTLDNISLIWNASYSGSTSTNAPGPNEIEATKSLNVLLTGDNGELIYSFYALNENLIVIPNLYVSSNAVVTVELDFGVPQAQNALDSVIGVHAIEENVSNNLNVTYPASTWIHKKHYLDNSLAPLRITQKGWHTIRIKTTVASTAVYGLEFLNYQDWDNAKKLKTLIP